MYQTSVSGENFVYVNRMSLMLGASSFLLFFCTSVNVLLLFLYHLHSCRFSAFLLICSGQILNKA